MQLLVKRDTFTSKSVTGLLSVDGQMAGYTLEPPKLDPPTKPRAIPAGTYDVEIAWSPKHGRFLPHVKNVPDFQGIEIHIGNFPQDTDGCLLVGESRGPDAVFHSSPEFTLLYAQIHAAWEKHEPIRITYVEVPASQTIPVSA